MEMQDWMGITGSYAYIDDEVVVLGGVIAGSSDEPTLVLVRDVDGSARRFKDLFGLLLQEGLELYETREALEANLVDVDATTEG